MKVEALRQAVDEMAGMPQALGCALVDLTGGMVWHAARALAEMEQVASSSSDYWRLYQRGHAAFDALGPLRAAVLMHAQGQMTISPCGRGMLLVLLTRQIGGFDWSGWQTRHARLARMVDAL